MSDGIYIGMAGATAREAQLEAVADDLANAQTPGYKAARPAFSTVLAQAGADRAFPQANGGGRDLRPGPTQPTGNPLDVVPGGDLFLAVRGDHGTAYTRDGRLSIDANGVLRAAGLPVLGENGEELAAPPGVAPSIGADGTVSAAGAIVGRLGLFSLSGRVETLGPSLLRAADATPAEGKVQTGEVELGNHEPLDAAVEMISAQRHFEASMQAIDTYRKLADRSSELGRVR